MAILAAKRNLLLHNFGAFLECWVFLLFFVQFFLECCFHDCDWLRLLFEISGSQMIIDNANLFICIQI